LPSSRTEIVVAGDAIVHGHLRFATARYLAA
jgi:hypothetical protein